MPCRNVYPLILNFCFFAFFGKFLRRSFPLRFCREANEPKENEAELRDCELARLAPLAREIPNIDSAIAEIARFSAELTLPRGTIHVISDIHGEDKKLRHVINNASGTLRPLVERLLQDRMPPQQSQEV